MSTFTHIPWRHFTTMYEVKVFLKLLPKIAAKETHTFLWNIIFTKIEEAMSSLKDRERVASLEKIRRRMGKTSPTAPSTTPIGASIKRKHTVDVLDEVFQHIERNQQKYIDVLAEAVAIPGVSR